MACFEITILKLRFEAKVNDTKSLLVSRESELKAFQLCIDKFSLVQVKLKSDSRIHIGYCAFFFVPLQRIPLKVYCLLKIVTKF